MPQNLDTLAGGGEMGALMRGRDWAATPLSDPLTWPQSLRSALFTCLNSRAVSAIYWGPEFRLFYNDAYRPFLDSRHPWALGRPMSEIWPTMWEALTASARQVYETGEGVMAEHQRLLMERDGGLAEAFWTYSFAPIRGETGRVDGIFVTALNTTERALAERRQAFRLALDEQVRHLADPIETIAAASEALGRHFGVGQVSYAEVEAGGEFMQVIHPEDRPRVEAAVDRAVETGDPYEIEYRVLQPGDEVRWILVRGRCLRNEAGEPVRFPGTAVDIHVRKLAEERQALLSREVDHRAKNALAVVQAALHLTRAPDLPSYVRAITGRVTALARAQTLLADERWAGADLRAMLAAEMDAFLTGGAAGEPRATLAGPTVALPAGAAQPLAMVVHELATNATKHGALSTPTGRVEVTWSTDGGPSGTLRLRWAEESGPPITAAPAQRGFGSRVLDGVVRGQLSGVLALAWNESGLVCDIALPFAQMAGVPGGDLATAKSA